MKKLMSVLCCTAFLLTAFASTVTAVTPRASQQDWLMSIGYDGVQEWSALVGKSDIRLRWNPLVPGVLDCEGIEYTVIAHRFYLVIDPTAQQVFKLGDQWTAYRQVSPWDGGGYHLTLDGALSGPRWMPYSVATGRDYYDQARRASANLPEYLRSFFGHPGGMPGSPDGKWYDVPNDHSDIAELGVDVKAYPEGSLLDTTVLSTATLDIELSGMTRDGFISVHVYDRSRQPFEMEHLRFVYNSNGSISYTDDHPRTWMRWGFGTSEWDRDREGYQFVDSGRDLLPLIEPYLDLPGLDVRRRKALRAYLKNQRWQRA
ncbi:MAG: hypothetical protein IT410_04485 [Candidatus Doudnabacteria bacterium]|nr:hypothetical protein [Candidatus Doudnabacteria bacterium]